LLNIASRLRSRMIPNIVWRCRSLSYPRQGARMKAVTLCSLYRRLCSFSTWSEMTKPYARCFGMFKGEVCKWAISFPSDHICILEESILDSCIIMCHLCLRNAKQNGCRNRAYRSLLPKLPLIARTRASRLRRSRGENKGRIRI
jgi:hypothetical protein